MAKFDNMSDKDLMKGIDTKEDKKSTKRSLYLYPRDSFTDEDREKLKDYGLEVKGYNKFNDERNVAVVGDKANFDKYNKEYLGYEMHPDYFYENEEDFAGDLQDEDFEDKNASPMNEFSGKSKKGTSYLQEDFVKDINEKLGGRGFDTPKGYLGVMLKENGKLVAGTLTNSGMFEEYQIDYDEDKSLDDNLSDLYDLATDESYKEDERETETEIDLEELDEDRHEDFNALNEALGGTMTYAKTGYDDNIIETDEGDFIIATEDEARELAKQDIENLFDDMGLESFTPNFQEWILENALDQDEWNKFIDEEISYYEEEYKDEPDEAENMRSYLENMRDNPKQYVDELGLDSKWLEKNIGFDMDKITEEAISVDGVAHFISYYDGKEIELPNGKFAYRIN